MQIVRKFSILLIFGIILPGNLIAKKKKEKEEKEGYTFTLVKEIKTTPVKDQANTGTCWSYATTSFLETEILRLNKGEHDLAEMYFVRLIYPLKAQKYLRYHGLANFSEGGQGHDVTDVVRKFGIVPEEAYSGIKYDLDYHQHDELVSTLKGILDISLKNMSNYSGKSMEIFSATLDAYLGATPDTFTYNGKSFTPHSFAKEMGINPENYIELTSYQSYPYYKQIDLEIPDNWSHDRYYNLPIDELMQIVDYAFDNNHSVNWDGDVSSRGFSHSNGVAVVPESDPKNMEDSERAKWEELPINEQVDMLYSFDKPIKEKVITQELRQKTFDKYNTTDDHLMHLVGVANDQNKTKYYLTKNSWADDSNDYGGYLYMSETYLRLNTTAIQVHVDAIPAEIKAKLGL